MKKTIAWFSLVLLLFSVTAVNAVAADNITQTVVKTNLAAGNQAAAGVGAEKTDPGFFFTTAGQVIAACVALAGLIAVAGNSDGSSSTTSHQ